MKRVIVGLFVIGMLLSLAACSSTPSDTSQPTETNVSEAPAVTDAPAAVADAESSLPEGPPEEPAGSRILVIYFSRTGEQYNVGVIEKGNTAIVAEMIAEATGADLYEILPADDHYPTTYKELTDVGLQEQRDHARPAYVDTVPDLNGYDTIFIDRSSN